MIYRDNFSMQIATNYAQLKRKPPSFVRDSPSIFYLNSLFCFVAFEWVVLEYEIELSEL